MERTAGTPFCDPPYHVTPADPYTRAVRTAAVVSGVILILFVLWDGFETIVMARRVSREIRLTRFFYWATWRPYCAIARLIKSGNGKENFLSIYGPMSLILLLALWALALIGGFALLQWGMGAGCVPQPA